jgi:prepilin-type processing-associated H-X9-DG protein
VVISIIGILVMLLMPAVNSARESARRAQCKNNLYQMGRAALQHESKLGFYPSGGWGWCWVGQPNRGYTHRQPGGWVYNILPFLDQQPLHDNGNAPDGDPVQMLAAMQLIQTTLSMTNCPSRRKAVLYPMQGGAYPNNAKAGATSVARGDYAACVGSNQSNSEYFGGPGSYSDGDNITWSSWHTPPVVAATSAPNGVCFEKSEVKAAQITDGTSNTFLFGEKYLSPDDYFGGGNYPAENENMYTGQDNDNYRITTAGNPPLRDRPGYTSTLEFGSPHATGVNFVFCDGSVHLISYGIDQTTYSNLGSRNDMQAVDPTKF